ncbi:hypothetical protein AALM74_05870 [Parabacteroides segnis]|uniref:hypothetical protein n=1 Tax=Parabacteroides segnis TaxID=2763058 RepID=UPI0035192CFF
MKTIKNIIYLLTGLIGLAFTGCSDDDSYEPGPQTSPNCMQVYFLNTNEATKVIDASEEYAITLEVGRTQTASAASVPIKIISQDEVLSIPTNVEFTAGQSVSAVKISFPNAKTATTYSYRIEIDGNEYVDPYAVLDGSYKFIGSVLVASWQVAIKNATFKFGSIFPEFKQDILQMEGTDKYKIENYLNSKTDLVFTVDPTTYVISPVGGYQSSATAWYFYNNDTEKIPIPCFPTGSDISINSFYLYLGASYTYLNLKTKKGRLYHYNYNSDETKGYNALSISWE